MIDVMIAAKERLEKGEDVVLATICESSGSTPRAAGATMVVGGDGLLAGTIGGGIVEGQAIEACQELLESSDTWTTASYDLTNTQAAQAGMICGGKLTACLVRLAAFDQTVTMCDQAIEALKKGLPTVMVCQLDERAWRFLLVDGKQAAETEPMPLDMAFAVTFLGSDSPSPQIVDAGAGDALILPMVAPSLAVIAGGGHVAMFTARVLAMAGFRVVVMDDREEFANRERFPDASEVIVLDDFNHCFKGMIIPQDASIVILTRGHSHDKTVLAQALKTSAVYIGMIGSKKKRDATYKALLEEGVKQKHIDRVHCPIGITIGAQTPEEIAVSIAAEVIAERARSRKDA